MCQRDSVQRVALLLMILVKPAFASHYPDPRPVGLGLTFLIALLGTGFAWSVAQRARRCLRVGAVCLATLAGFAMGSMSVGWLFSSGLGWGGVLVGWAGLTFLTSVGVVKLLTRSPEVEELSSEIGY